MLACLSGPGDLSFQLLSHTQMNTGLQKWDTTQKMKAARYPTPAELDAYAKKVANNPLTIKIFPNSVKVPQRKHIRRTVNGLDTSGQRYSPYPAQASSKSGLLAIVKHPAKGILKDFEGARAHLLPKVMMNPPSSPYAAPSTLSHPQVLSHPQSLQHAQALQHAHNMQQQQTMARPQSVPQVLQHHHPSIQQTLQHHPAMQQTLQQHSQGMQQTVQHSQGMQQTLQPHPPGMQQALQRQRGMQRALQQAQLQAQQQAQQHAQNMSRSKSMPQPLQRPQSITQSMQHPQSMSQQTLQHPQSIQQQNQPHSQSVVQTLQHSQSMTQSQHPQSIGQSQALQHPQSMAQPPAQHSQSIAQAQPLQLPSGLPHQTLQNPLLQPSLHGGRKMPDADAPPNVTVSTSTIPLSMLQQNRPPDLTSIVQQINQFCQARAGLGSTSVCEGQIANPSPISRNVLINASTRVSTHNLPMSACVGNPTDHAAAISAASGNVPIVNIRMPASYPSDLKPLAWNQHQLAHLQQMCGEAGKHPSCEMAVQGFPIKTAYPQELCMGQSFNLKPPIEKPTPSPPVNGLPGPLPYSNGHYFQPMWNNILPTPNSDSSGSQELALPFHGGQTAAAPLDCAMGPHYRAGAGSSGQNNIMQTMDYLGGEYQQSCFRDQNMATIGKVQRPPVGHAPEPTDSHNLHLQHPGYR